jgi:hypothetical protein
LCAGQIVKIFTLFAKNSGVNMLSRLLILPALLLVCASSYASWKTTEKIDSMTDERRKLATVVNESGHTFSIYRIANGSVWANFALSERSLDQLASKTPPLFRVDKFEAHDLSEAKRMQDMGVGIQAYSWEPKWVNFLVWHGKESEGRSATIDQLMLGKSLTVRYYLFTGGHKETTFTLANARQAITAALSINADSDQAKELRIKRFKDSYLDATKRCQQDLKSFSECF